MGALHDVAKGTPLKINDDGSLNAVTSLTLANPLPTDPSDRAARLLGHVTVDNASLAVTGTFWQSTQPVSGPLTDTQLRATAVPVSGTVTASGPLTDTQLRATAVPVSGTVTANTGLSQPLTDTQLRASAVPVSGTFFQGTQPVSGSGTFTTKETRSTAGASTAFAASVSNATVLASNGSRLGATVYNNNATANLYVKFGATATTAAGGFTVKIAAGGYYEVPYGYTGIIDGIWDAATGNAASITEIT